MNLILLITVLLISQSLFTNSYAQNKSNCDCAECHEFDFWVGDWKATWQDSSGIISEGSNSIKKILGDCVIIENFDGNPGIDYTGKSFSVYNQNKKNLAANLG